MKELPKNKATAVNAYVNLRTHIQDLEQKHKDELEGLREELETIHDELLEFCHEENIDSNILDLPIIEFYDKLGKMVLGEKIIDIGVDSFEPYIKNFFIFNKRKGKCE